ncbi:hypothetical protein ACR2V7_25385, partial [Klebsiella pneumoniae]
FMANVCYKQDTIQTTFSFPLTTIRNIKRLEFEYSNAHFRTQLSNQFLPLSFQIKITIVYIIMAQKCQRLWSTAGKSTAQVDLSTAWSMAAWLGQRLGLTGQWLCLTDWSMAV